MLQSFYIDGFKSLENCQFNLTPGLNVLVGENDTGKSNILSGLEFSSYIVTSGLNEIPKKLGVEGWENLLCLSRDEKEIHLILNGENQTACRNIKFPPKVNSDSLDRFIKLNTKYQYQCKIQFSPQGSIPARFIYQSIELDFNLEGKEEYTPSRFVVCYENDTLELKECHMTSIKKHISPKFDLDLQSPREVFEQAVRNSLLANLQQQLYPIRNIIQELTFCRAFEIRPNIVRLDSKNVLESEIQYDGRGLSAVFLNLKEKKPKLFDFIVEEIKLLSNHLLDIGVSYNEINKEIEIFAKKSSSNTEETFEIIPFHFLSDGVLKWVTMVVITVLSEKSLIIDEPENFLYPEIQQEFVTFVRDILLQKMHLGIITSHSNMLIDVLEPEEIIAVKFENGRTTANRVKDLDKFRDDMKKAEVGLGWYFQSGNLELYCT